MRKLMLSVLGAVALGLAGCSGASSGGGFGACQK